MKTKNRERFEKVAVSRTNKILDDLRLLGNCSNKNNYEYSDSDIKKIFAAIENELKKTKERFSQTTKKETFKL